MLGQLVPIFLKSTEFNKHTVTYIYIHKQNIKKAIKVDSMTYLVLADMTLIQSWKSQNSSIIKGQPTVDGRNPAPAGRWFIPLQHHIKLVHSTKGQLGSLAHDFLSPENLHRPQCAQCGQPPTLAQGPAQRIGPQEPDAGPEAEHKTIVLHAPRYPFAPEVRLGSWGRAMPQWG